MVIQGIHGIDPLFWIQQRNLIVEFRHEFGLRLWVKYRFTTGQQSDSEKIINFYQTVGFL